MLELPLELRQHILSFNTARDNYAFAQASHKAWDTVADEQYLHARLRQEPVADSFLKCVPQRGRASLPHGPYLTRALRALNVAERFSTLESASLAVGERYVKGRRSIMFAQAYGEGTQAWLKLPAMGLETSVRADPSAGALAAIGAAIVGSAHIYWWKSAANEMAVHVTWPATYKPYADEFHTERKLGPGTFQQVHGGVLALHDESGALHMFGLRDAPEG